MEKILSKADIEEIYKDIYAQPEYRKLAEKHRMYQASGKIAQALIYAKKMKNYEVGVFEGVARRIIDSGRLVHNLISGIPENERKNISILSYSVYMLSDVLERYIMDLNQLMKKHSNQKVYGFDKMNQAMREAKEVVLRYDDIMKDEKATSLFGHMSDDLYKMIFNKSSSYYNKLKAHAEKVDKETSRSAEMA